ncbi:MacB family efflux pump subunit [Rhodobacter ferrooxidans]|uniref:Pyoverdine export ATP-binding/permease protein PvdT n=1 Tax=Rhodobacter ferrooxidans TaxID=371731 RepID=C8S4U6_9RHOB|nr:MacB family efflux pump subunit [Rhodobacter sp. SW2]EEW24005.1 ABC transporter related protein [Rhodobacter sp. SW2]
MSLISLQGIGREFLAGDEHIVVLDGITLDIDAGEMVAIIGASGSGKSTLMNILGCLDRPTSGTYTYAGQDVGELDGEDRARLRREHFGFIFQRYQLLPDLDARANVEVPAVYKGTSRRDRKLAATTLLTQLGLGDRMDHRPNALSGGQQQRVSVARALINGGEVILADEPTGALDTKAGADLMALLAQLHSRGHTLIIVTHDPDVAALANRIVEIRDGRIVSDTRKTVASPADRLVIAESRDGRGGTFDRITEAFSMATRSMNAHRLRTFLTMLGIIIGIASVVLVVALGAGSKQKVLEDISSIGTSTISIRAGTGFGDRRAEAITTLVPADATALASQPYAVSVSPSVNTNAMLNYRSVSTAAQVQGVGGGYFDLASYDVTEGQVFGDDAISRRDQVAVIDTDTATTLFTSGEAATGSVILLGRVPVRVIGVVKNSGASFGPQTLKVFVPYTTVSSRITGKDSIDSISVKIDDAYGTSAAEALITDLMIQRHGVRDFFLTNSDTIRETIESTASLLTMLVSAIAVISLIVGGIGVMNIMLVSVTERTKEIGVRIAVGARSSDIVMQFLIESILVCLLGGILGVGLAWGVALIASAFLPFKLVFSLTAVLAAFASSTVIGIAFGFLPARSASKLDPVVALSRE